jgi:hypothetical protein
VGSETREASVRPPYLGWDLEFSRPRVQGIVVGEYRSVDDLFTCWNVYTQRLTRALDSESLFGKRETAPIANLL